MKEPLSDEILSLVWAFGDEGRKAKVRELALRVREMERELEQLRREVAAQRELEARAAGVELEPDAVCQCGHRLSRHRAAFPGETARPCLGTMPDYCACLCASFKQETP